MREDAINEVDVFGELIVRKDMFGHTREILTGMRIPDIMYIIDYEEPVFYSTFTVIPHTPFRVRPVGSSLVSTEDFLKYCSEHYDDIEKFKEELFEFKKACVQNRKSIRKNRFKSKRRVKRVS